MKRVLSMVAVIMFVASAAGTALAGGSGWREERRWHQGNRGGWEVREQRAVYEDWDVMHRQMGVVRNGMALTMEAGAMLSGLVSLISPPPPPVYVTNGGGYRGEQHPSGNYDDPCDRISDSFREGCRQAQMEKMRRQMQEDRAAGYHYGQQY